MILTNKENYTTLVLNARDVLTVKDYGHFRKVLMKDGSFHLVHEDKFHIKTLMIIELIKSIQECRNEKI